MLGRLIPAGVRVLFIPPTVELSVLTKADIDGRIGSAESEVDRHLEEGRRLIEEAYTPACGEPRIVLKPDVTPQPIEDHRTLHGTPPQ